MPDIVFRLVLPFFWLGFVAFVAANRWWVARRLGRDPVVIRPGQRADSTIAYLEALLSLGALVVTVDVVLNAVAPAMVAETMAVPVLRTSRVAGLLGLGLLALGSLLAAVAVRQMALSWRIGIDDQAPGPMVSRGVFARVRHPIYAGMLLATAGIAAVTADVLSIAVAAAAAVGLPVQARLEEEFLRSRHPQDYPAYLARTGRFWPKMS